MISLFLNKLLHVPNMSKSSVVWSSFFCHCIVILCQCESLLATTVPDESAVCREAFWSDTGKVSIQIYYLFVWRPVGHVIMSTVPTSLLIYVLKADLDAWSCLTRDQYLLVRFNTLTRGKNWRTVASRLDNSAESAMCSSAILSLTKCLLCRMLHVWLSNFACIGSKYSGFRLHGLSRCFFSQSELIFNKHVVAFGSLLLVFSIILLLLNSHFRRVGVSDRNRGRILTRAESDFQGFIA